MQSLLVNENETKRFLEKVAPKLEKDEVLLLSLAVRGKYCPGVESSGAFLNSMVLRNNDINDIMLKIRRMSYVDKCYISYRTGNYINPECMVIYIDLQPRAVKSAMNLLFKEYMDVVSEENVNYELLKKFTSWSKMRHVLAKNRSKKLLLDIDIDIKDEDLLNNILDIVDDNVECVIESRGGYHVIIINDKRIAKELYEKYSKNEYIEFSSKQVQVPIPGTLQGGFEVKLIE